MVYVTGLDLQLPSCSNEFSVYKFLPPLNFSLIFSMIDEMYKVVHYLIHKADQEHSQIETSQNSLELPFSMNLEKETSEHKLKKSLLIF